MITVEDAKNELAQLTQKYIVRNNMEFDEEHYSEIVIAICTLHHFLIWRKHASISAGLVLDQMPSIIVDTESMVTTFLVAAEKLMPALCSSQIDQLIIERVDQWYQVENTNKLLETSKLLFDFDIREKFGDFLV